MFATCPVINVRSHGEVAGTHFSAPYAEREVFRPWSNMNYRKALRLHKPLLDHGGLSHVECGENADKKEMCNQVLSKRARKRKNTLPQMLFAFIKTNQPLSIPL